MCKTGFIVFFTINNFSYASQAPGWFSITFWYIMEMSWSDSKHKKIQLLSRHHIWLLFCNHLTTKSQQTQQHATMESSTLWSTDFYQVSVDIRVSIIDNVTLLMPDLYTWINMIGCDWPHSLDQSVVVKYTAALVIKWEKWCPNLPETTVHFLTLSVLVNFDLFWHKKKKKTKCLLF